jgi:hypothetical protein
LIEKPTVNPINNATPFRHAPFVTMRPFFAGALLALLSSLTILETAAQRWGFPYGDQKVRGVNLGGWLVLEV